MNPNIEKVLNAFQEEFNQAQSPDALQQLKIKYLGKKGQITALSKQIGEQKPEDRKSFGQEVNQVKQKAENEIDRHSAELEEAAEVEAAKREKVDFSLPGRLRRIGKRHPLTVVKEEILSIFNQLGFVTVDGPEIEQEYYNFEALNLPEDHPARDSQDSLYLKPGYLLRTQTSPVQIRTMEKVSPPLAIVSPGRVYRRDTIDSTHSPIFNQIEGLFVDSEVSFAHLKGLLYQFCQKMFSPKVKLRFSPDYFPFTEPSCQMSISDPSMGKGDQWLEILGAGLVNPLVLKNVGINPDEYNGLAFGLGVDRIAMLKYGITDIRYLYENDADFIEQF